MALATALLTVHDMSAATLELNVPTMSFCKNAWVVTVPARLGSSQQYHCATQAIAQRLLALFVRAVERRAETARAGWPFSR